MEQQLNPEPLLTIHRLEQLELLMELTIVFFFFLENESYLL